MAESARSLAAAADAELSRYAESLAILAASPLLDRPAANLRELDAQARATAGVLGVPVAVADTSLAQLVNTAASFGTLLPGLGDAAVALRALESGSVAYGEQLAAGADQAPPAAVVAAPVRRDGADVAVVATRIEASQLGRAVGTMAREGRAAALADRNGRVIASNTRLPYRALPATSGQGARPTGSGRASAADGTAFLYATSPLRTVPGWTLITSEPARAIPLWSAALPSFLGAGLAASIAVLAIGSARRRRPRERVAEGILVAERARAAAEDSEAEALRTLSELKRLHDTIPVGLALLGRDRHFLSVNAKLAAVAGISGAEHIGRCPSDVLPPGIAEPIEDAHRRVLATGRPVMELPLSGEAPGTVRNTRHFLASCHPVQDGEGRNTGVSIVLQDVTERIRAEKGRELLVRELNHRVKNTLATVQSIANATLRRTGANPQRLSADLGARLRALARAHDLLTTHAWEAADLAEIARAALAPWLDGMPARLMIDGPSGVFLRPRQAQAVVLALHELATNAAKHGALSREAGCASLRWRTESDGQTIMEWVETGGPAVVEPPHEKRGFGTRLLERALVSDLGSGTEVRLVFAPEGLRAHVAFRHDNSMPEEVAA
ncbi:HWE histidine kinase domain-containing protein [Siccirubricoccus sp. G192]|uniref:HWE histidine kinase domain-containing protein n=1 Tax=Siccirubricoccus sp. G192 TaxID=2849651 RepID=UPI001C2BA223|nr:HWE histidine kinase domain-containing protein [Siccirubricoccus sp. G192]MBV1799631.1 PAS domain-containing protein [Siccirubricoccus sp. G192]